MSRRRRRDRRGRYRSTPLNRLNRRLWRANKKTARFVFWRVFF